MNPELESYYDIMSFLDDKATSDQYLTTRDIMYLHSLAKNGGHTIEDIADANDCGSCHDWNELLSALKEQFRTGERVPIDSATDVYEQELYDKANSMYSDAVEVLNAVYQELFAVQRMYSNSFEYEAGFRDGLGNAMDIVETYMQDIGRKRKKYIDDND